MVRSDELSSGGKGGYGALLFIAKIIKLFNPGLLTECVLTRFKYPSRDTTITILTSSVKSFSDGSLIIESNSLPY